MRCSTVKASACFSSPKATAPQNWKLGEMSMSTTFAKRATSQLLKAPPSLEESAGSREGSAGSETEMLSGQTGQHLSFHSNSWWPARCKDKMSTCLCWAQSARFTSTGLGLLLFYLSYRFITSLACHFIYFMYRFKKRISSCLMQGAHQRKTLA